MRTVAWIGAALIVACTPSTPTRRPSAPPPPPSPNPSPGPSAAPSEPPPLTPAPSQGSTSSAQPGTPRHSSGSGPEVLVGTILTPDPAFDAQGAMRKEVDRFVPCYEAALTRAPGLRGKMLIRLEVDRSGKVSKAEDAGSALHEPALLSCVLTEVQKVSFPPPKGTATVTAPLVFRPPAPR